MKENKILVIIKKPGEPPVVEPLFSNTPEAFQKEVGGYIETVTFASDTALVVNEEGLLMGLPYNCKVFGLDLVGPVILVGVDGDEFASLKAASIPMLLRAMGG
jgi:hypothetical protein